jgi:hypothetical protein
MPLEIGGSCSACRRRRGFRLITELGGTGLHISNACLFLQEEPCVALLFFCPCCNAIGRLTIPSAPQPQALAPTHLPSAPRPRPLAAAPSPPHPRPGMCAI